MLPFWPKVAGLVAVEVLEQRGQNAVWCWLSGVTTAAGQVALAL